MLLITEEVQIIYFFLAKLSKRSVRVQNLSGKDTFCLPSSASSRNHVKEGVIEAKLENVESWD